MSSNVRIERASTGDIPAMVELLADLFAIEQDFSVDQGKQSRGLLLLLQDRERAIALVAKDRDQVIGMVTAQLVISTAEGAPSAWIEDMVVRRDHRGRGVGRALLESLLRWAKSRGAARAQLLVDTDNTPALAYYQRLNWQTTQLVARRLSM